MHIQSFFVLGTRVGRRLWETTGGLDRFSPPIAGVVNGLGVDSKLFTQPLNQYLHPLYLAVGWMCGFAVGDDTNPDCLAGAIPGSAGYGRPLFLPSFRCLYLTVGAPETITQTEVAVDIIRIGEAAERGQLLYVAGLCAAVEDLDTIPPAG